MQQDQTVAAIGFLQDVGGQKDGDALIQAQGFDVVGKVAAGGRIGRDDLMQLSEADVRASRVFAAGAADGAAG